MEDMSDLALERTQLADLLATAPEVTDAMGTCSASMADAVYAALDVGSDATTRSFESAVDTAAADCDRAQQLAAELEYRVSNLGL
jgi:hypothetical protein